MVTEYKENMVTIYNQIHVKDACPNFKFPSLVQSN